MNPPAASNHTGRRAAATGAGDAGGSGSGGRRRFGALATTRNVTVTINAKTGTDSYEVPATPVVPKAFSGLYLTIGVPGREHTAAVAGFNLGYSTAFPTITQAMLDDVKAALLGRISIKVEAAAPSGSVLLDEWISEKLAVRQAVEFRREAFGGPGHVLPHRRLTKQADSEVRARLR